MCGSKNLALSLKKHAGLPLTLQPTLSFQREANDSSVNHSPTVIQIASDDTFGTSLPDFQ